MFSFMTKVNENIHNLQKDYKTFYGFTDLRGNWEEGGGGDAHLRIKTSPV